MRVRLIRKLAERIDGVDLSGRHVGDVLDLPDRKARLLLAEEWATPQERRHAEHSAVRFDRRRTESPPLDDVIR